MSDNTSTFTKLAESRVTQIVGSILVTLLGVLFTLTKFSDYLNSRYPSREVTTLQMQILNNEVVDLQQRVDELDDEIVTLKIYFEQVKK